MKKKEIEVECELTKIDYEFLLETLLSWNLKKLIKRDKAKTFARLDMKPPEGRKFFDKKVTLEDSRNGYTLVVHIAWSELYDQWFPKGVGYTWVLIRKGDRSKYFAKPFQKTTTMVPKVLRYIQINQEKISNLPLCPSTTKEGKKCNAEMIIARRKDRRGYFLVCPKQNQHAEGEPYSQDWDVNISEEDKGYLKIRRMYTTYYKRRCKKLGLTPRPAATIRKRWTENNSQNLE